MTEKDDLRARLYELHVGTDEHHATARQIRVMIQDGDLAGAADALDALDADIHPALAGGVGGGGGLPEQWTDGGNGDVTATVDDPDKTPFTIDGVVGHSIAALIVNEPDDGSNYQDVVVVVGDKGGPDEENLFSIDSAGQVLINTKDVGASALNISPASGSAVQGAHIISVSTDGVASGTLLDLEASGKFSVGNTELADGLLLHGPHAAPTDAAMNSGDLMLWFDKTNGAAKLMIKAKTANGTVVIGQVALS